MRFAVHYQRCRSGGRVVWIGWLSTDYTVVVYPQWGQRLCITRSKWCRLTAAGQRQRVVIRKPEIIRPKPITRFQYLMFGMGKDPLSLT